jgi:hypothetical protein
MKYNSTLAFCKLFAQELIYNEYFIKEQENASEKNRRSNGLNSGLNHELLAIPTGKIVLNGKLVPSVCKYATARCSTCKKKGLVAIANEPLESVSALNVMQFIF